MTIAPDLTAQILRYHHAERWPVGTISSQLKVHRDTVIRVLTQAGASPIIPAQRPSGVTPYLPFIEQTLKQFPNLTASRLHAMVVERGYGGRPDHFRHLIARHRPRPPAEAYLRLRTLPGEQCQCDWGHFGHIKQGQAKRPLMAFVMVLSWSRRIFLRFFLGAHMENFLRGHVQAFESWGAVPRVTLYDNLKSAVLERKGQAIRFNPVVLALSAHYHFEPRPVAPARGNQKGRVERSIRYIRDNFFAARTFTDIDDLNAQADAWVAGASSQRPCPEDAKITVHDAFEQERPSLMALPATPFSCDELRAVSVGKTPYVRFDLNDYSIPTPMCSVASPCTPTCARYAFWMANRCWPPTGAAGTRASKSRSKPTWRNWCNTSGPGVPTATLTAWCTQFLRSRRCSRRLPSGGSRWGAQPVSCRNCLMCMGERR